MVKGVRKTRTKEKVKVRINSRRIRTKMPMLASSVVVQEIMHGIVHTSTISTTRTKTRETQARIKRKERTVAKAAKAKKPRARTPKEKTNQKVRKDNEQQSSLNRQTIGQAMMKAGMRAGKMMINGRRSVTGGRLASFVGVVTYHEQSAEHQPCSPKIQPVQKCERVDANRVSARVLIRWLTCIVVLAVLSMICLLLSFSIHQPQDRSVKIGYTICFVSFEGSSQGIRIGTYT